MFHVQFRRFLDDESGSYTIWSLVWFALYLAMGGLAVDMTNAYRNQTMLQSTADAAALAGVMSLPDNTAVVANALVFSASNMNTHWNGNVLKAGDVYIGSWNSATGTFSNGAATPDAVLAVTRRDSVNGNPVATNFLRILTLFGIPADQWDIKVEAIAIKYVPDCLTKNGLVAYNKVDVTSNNGFSGICIHAQNVTLDPGQNYAIDIGNNNTFTDTVQVSMPDLADLNGRPNVCTNNPGLCDPGVLVSGDMWPKDVDNIADIIDGLKAADPDYVLGSMYHTDADGNVINPDYELIDENFAGPYEAYHIYEAKCANSNKILSLPTGVLIEKVIIVADCKIKSASGAILADAVIASSAVGNGQDSLSQHSIDLASDTTIGTNNFCTDNGGQVHIYAMASAHVAAGPSVYGLRAVVGGDFHFTANTDVYGISVEAGNNITATANGQFTLCGGTFNGPFAWHYRLVL